MKITYLIALYNKVEFIVRAVDSVLEDTSPEYNVEVCIVDDGSTDGSFEVVAEKYAGNSAVKLSKFSANKGKNAAYNAAYLMSDSDFVSLLGADDEIIQGRGRTLLAACLRTGLPVYAGLRKKVVSTGVEHHMAPPVIPSIRHIAMQNTLSGGCLMMSRAQAESVFPIPEQLKFEDWWISFNLMTRYGAVTVPDPVLVYNIHGANDSGVEVLDYEAVRRDYVRHLDYIVALMSCTTDKTILRYLQRSLAIRKAFLQRSSFAALLRAPIDASWLRLCLLTILGGQRYYSLVLFIKKFR